MFKQLKEIDVSCNEIKNIDCLYEMALPHLEYLDMSNNEIENIEPIACLESKKLKEICLQDNKIKDIGPFEDSDFPEIQILRVEGNEDLNYANYSNILEKYKGKIVYKKLTLELFKKKYHLDDNIINLEDINAIDFLNLSNVKKGDNMIKDLYCIIQKNNKIKKFKLNNNDIKDPSLLTRIPLPELKSLDLSVNKINNLKFLTKMEANKLIALYLNDNIINGISPLRRVIEEVNIYGDKMKKLRILSLDINSFNIQKNKDLEYLNNLKKENNEKQIELDISIEE